MRRILMCLLLMAPWLAFGQSGVRFDSSVVTSSTAVPPGAQAPLFVFPYSVVTVCAYPASSLLVTCTNTVPVYSNPALTLPITQPLTADIFGRFGFWLGAGNYSYSISDPSGNFLGSYILTIGAGGSSGTGTVTSVAAMNGNGFVWTIGGNANVNPTLSLNLDSTHILPVNNGSADTWLNGAGGYTVPPGGITSFGLVMPPSLFSVAGSPLTSAGIITVGLASQSGNCFFASPSGGGSGAPTCRGIVGTDLPVATGTTFGVVKPDGTSCTVTAGVLTCGGSGTGAVLLAPPGGASQSVAGPLNATAVSGGTISGYWTVDGTTYTTLNAVWTAAAAFCTANTSGPSPTILLAPQTYTITSALVEPTTANCTVNLLGSTRPTVNPNGTVIQATAAMTTMISNTSTAQAISISGVSFIGGGFYTGGPGWQLYATYCMDLNGSAFIRDVTARNCGSSAGGEAVRFGFIGGGGSTVQNLSVNYDEGLYSVPQGTTAGPFTPPAYGVDMEAGFSDSSLYGGGSRNATTASYYIATGASDVKTYGVHGFGAQTIHSGVYVYAPLYVIEDNGGGNNVHTNPILDTFSKAGIYMLGAYNEVIAPGYYANTPTVTLTQAPASLVRFGINAKNDAFLGGTCQGYNTTFTPMTSEFLYDSGAANNQPLLGSSYTSAAGCGFFTYQYQNGGGNGAGINYTPFSCIGGLCVGAISIRELEGQTGQPLIKITTQTSSPIFTLDDRGNETSATSTNSLTTITPVGTIPVPVLAVVGTPGTTTYSYECTGVVSPGESLGTVATVTTGPATLSGTNYITITCPFATQYVNTYNVYRTAGGATQGLINSGLSAQSLVKDTGIAAIGSVPVVDTTGNVVGPNWSIPYTGAAAFAIGSTVNGSPICTTANASVNCPSSGGGTVSSVFTRTGAVAAVSGDYTIGQISGVATYLASPPAIGGTTPNAIYATSVQANGNIATVGQTATSGSNFYSPNVVWNGTYWNGTASAADDWIMQDVLGTGTNPTSTLTFSHSSSTTGAATVSIPNASLTGIPTAPTATSGTNTTQVATMAALQTAVSGLGTGTITAVVPAGPLGGGGTSGSVPITCATCVTASSPGVGIAHFAGSTQAATSSAVNLASADVTGVLAVANGGTNTATAPAAAQIPVAQSATAYAPETVSGDCTFAATGAITCTKSNGTALGTMATQNASAVAVTGGTINNTVIGATTAVNGTFTSLTATSGINMTQGSLSSSTGLLMTAANLSTGNTFTAVLGKANTAGNAVDLMWNNAATPYGAVETTGSTAGSTALQMSGLWVGTTTATAIDNGGTLTALGFNCGTGIALCVAPTSNTAAPYTVSTAGASIQAGTATGAAFIPTGQGTVTAAVGSNVTSVTCATATCTNQRGTYTIVGGTATTGTIATLTWAATTAAWACTVSQNGGTAAFGIGHSVASTTGMTITAGISVISATFAVDYTCQP
jgi:hypothetical protein